MAIDGFAKYSLTILQAVLVSVCFCLVLPSALSQIAAPALSQSTTTPPGMTFDVASVRESHPDPVKGFMVGGGFTGRTSALRLSNDTILDMLVKAYGLSSQNISGLPAWTADATYDVQAKSDEATDKRLASLTDEQVALEQQHMLQVLLAERFNLKAHWSTRELPTYNLVLAKGGTKVHKGGSMPQSEEDLKRFDGTKHPEIYQRGDGTHMATNSSVVNAISHRWRKSWEV